MIGYIHSFQSLGTVDGPGIRTVLFLQGCLLRCPYCHNPDTWDKTAGTPVDSSDAVKKVLRYKSYFGSDGGATVSGGEPLLQSDFVIDLFSKLKAENINTALDTSGVIIDDNTEKILSLTDTVLLDIKYSDDENYKKYIGISLKKPLDFLSLCEKSGTDVIIRQVITPGVNDSEGNIIELNRLLAPFKCVKKVELLPFRKLCAEKYENLEIPFPFGDRPEMSEEKIAKLKALLEKS